jgi:hypothetical protein
MMTGTTRKKLVEEAGFKKEKEKGEARLKKKGGIFGFFLLGRGFQAERSAGARGR